MDRTERMLGEAVGEHVARHGHVRPPWVEFPDTARFTSFWLMGAGEWHMMTWRHWWARAGLSPEQQLEYFRGHRPPTSWLDWVASELWPELDDGDKGLDEAVLRLEVAGLGTHAAWARWLEQDA